MSLTDKNCIKEDWAVLMNYMLTGLGGALGSVFRFGIGAMFYLPYSMEFL